MDGYRRHLLKRLLGSLDRLTLERQKTADDYRSILIVREGVEIPLSSVNGFPGNLRFPVLVDSQKRERILASPEARRFGLTGMYPSPLSVIRDLPAAGDYTTEEGSGKIAKSILTLPTHRGIGKAGRNMVRRITELIK
jgi:dTDP-4-amino-4,6-dideoxygalactose transaminase